MPSITSSHQTPMDIVCRYRTELRDKASLTAAARQVLEAWSVCRDPYAHQHTQSSSGTREKHVAGTGQGAAGVAGEANDNLGSPDRKHPDNERPKSASPDAAVAIPNAHGQLRGNASPATTVPEVVVTPHDPPTTREDIFSSSRLPEDAPTGGTTRKHSSLLRVLGFAAELDPSSRTASVAIVAEWPGIGSVHDFLTGRAGIRGASQEDLLRWTRQAVEGLVRVNSGSCDGGDGVAGVLRISTRSIYLFVRPKEDCEDGGDVLDVRVRECRVHT